MTELKYYGIKNKKTDEWIRFGNGEIFWTTSYVVAQAQLKIGTVTNGEWEIAEFV